MCFYRKQQSEVGKARVVVLLPDIAVMNIYSSTNIATTKPIQRVALARRSPLFSGIAQPDCLTILAVAYERNFLRRQKIFLEHDPVTQVVLLVAGCVKEMQFSQNGGEVILRLDGPGELVGPAWCSTKGHYSSAQAIQPSKTFIWDADRFERLALCFPALQRNTARMLDERLATMQQRFRELSTDTAASRLSNEVLRLADQMGRQINGHIQISLSHEELAQLTATSHFTVSRLLAKWEERGIVTAQREVLLVRNLAALADVAQIEARSTVRPSD
jgi:CRP-like cAMP-binding protein